MESRDTAGQRLHDPEPPSTSSTSACADTVSPAVPSGLRAVDGGADGGLTLQRGCGDGQRLRSIGHLVDPDGGRPPGQTSLLTYPVSGLTCGTSYTFAVASRDPAGYALVTRASFYLVDRCVVAATPSAT